MMQSLKRTMTTMLACVCTLVVAGLADADAPDEGWSMCWHTIDAGGGSSSGDTWAASGTIGQHDPGECTGDGWTLSGGYWAASVGDVVPQCVGDVTTDGVVNVNDLLALLGGWGGGDPDLDIAPAGGDGVVDILDLLAVLGAWGPCP